MMTIPSMHYWLDVQAGRYLRAELLLVTRLDAAHVREPCTAEWDAMVGSDRIRFCASCRKDVYDVSAFTADEAEVLLRGASGRVCIIVERDAKGRTLTADRLPPRKPLRRLATIATAASVAIGIGACGKSELAPAPDASAPAADAGAARADARRPGCYCQPGDPLCSCL